MKFSRGNASLRTTGVYDAMATSPLSVGEIVGGELLWEATRSVLYGLIFLSVLALFGLVRSAWVLALHEHLFFYFTLAITPMFMFSGVFFPVERMPGPLPRVVKALPLYHVVELARSLVLGGASAGDLIHLGWLLLLTLAALALPVPLLRRALNR
ncbi:MAG: ABC transporter permease [Bacillota bacterium]|nr:ABC transporter permease [Bacillota bacterium]